MTRRTFTLQLYDRIEPGVVRFYGRSLTESDAEYRERVIKALGSAAQGSPLDPMMAATVDQMAIAMRDQDRKTQALLREVSLNTTTPASLQALMQDHEIPITNGTVDVFAGADVQAGGAVERKGVKIGTAMHDAKAGDVLTVRLSRAGAPGPNDLCQCGAARLFHHPRDLNHPFELRRW